MISIILISLIILAFIFYSVEEIVKENECTQHTFTHFRSHKIKRCIDCGLEVNIDATNW